MEVVAIAIGAALYLVLLYVIVKNAIKNGINQSLLFTQEQREEEQKRQKKHARDYVPPQAYEISEEELAELNGEDGPQ